MYKDKEGSDKLLKKAEKQLNKLETLYLQGIPKTRYEDVHPKYILHNILENQIARTTLYSSSNDLQCYFNRKRSAGDIYCIMKYYYPEITFKQLREMLLELINEREVGSMYCGRINKRVYFSKSQSGSGLYANCGLGIIHLYDYPDEFGLIFELC